VRRLLKSLRIPVSTVDLVLAEGKTVSLCHVLRENEKLSLYPVFELLDISPLQRVRSRPLRRTRFSVGPDLARLAIYLRLFGFDVIQGDRKVAEEPKRCASGGQRILLLSRGTKRQRPKAAAHALRITRSRPFHQFLEVVERLDLKRFLAPYTRCIYCNRRLPRQRRRGVSSLESEWHGAQPCCHTCEGIHLGNISKDLRKLWSVRCRRSRDPASVRGAYHRSYGERIRRVGLRRWHSGKVPP
jgi:uncharacterized protein